MVAGVAATYAVVTVDVDVFLEVLVSLYECLGVFGGILEMNVIVGKSVADEQRSMELCGDRKSTRLNSSHRL